ncbi:MAG: response regulator [Deltaproteobacteria bacterium]|jgi:two-component system, chemotaxis family, chemotaxis protein CheY
MSKILIIEDSALSRRMLREILESAGHDVVDAHDGISGLERYFLEKPDLVTLDLTMKYMHGLDVLARLREMDPTAKVVIASADIQNTTHAMVKEAGAAGFIGKPFVAEAVLEKIAATLKGSKS